MGFRGTLLELVFVRGKVRSRGSEVQSELQSVRTLPTCNLSIIFPSSSGLKMKADREAEAGRKTKRR